MPYLIRMEWRTIPGTIYEVSNMGNVRNDKRILKPFSGGKYLAVWLGAGNKHYIHRLVAKLFLQEIEGCCVDHINRDKYDNRAENLRWTSWANNSSNTGVFKTNTSTGHKNVSKSVSGSYCVRIYRNGKYCLIKNFLTLEEAITARNNFLALQ